MIDTCGREGSILPDQAQFITDFIREHKIKHIMEIGFNEGNSASTMLSVSDTRVTSFDIGYHSYVLDAKKIIDDKFPDGRHLLVIGDSTKTVPMYTPSTPFDMIFVDGGHDNDVPYLDIKNSLRLLRDDGNGFIIVDDYCNMYGQCVIPCVKRCVHEDLVELVSTHHGICDRGWVVLKKKVCFVNRG